MDDVCEKKEQKMKNESLKVDELKQENSQIKALNNKLLERVETLQSIIDQQASANTFYYNYPPKPAKELEGKKESQTEKIKKIFEE